jgi:hypothetical protein
MICETQLVHTSWRVHAITYLTTRGDLRQSRTVELHDLCGSSSDVVGTSTEGLAAGSFGIATEASRVLLEGVATSAVTGSGGVNTDGRALATSIAGSTDDSAVTSNERRRSQEAEGNNGRLGEVHTEPVRWMIRRIKNKSIK